MEIVRHPGIKVRKFTVIYVQIKPMRRQRLIDALKVVTHLQRF